MPGSVGAPEDGEQARGSEVRAGNADGSLQEAEEVSEDGADAPNLSGIAEAPPDTNKAKQRGASLLEPHAVLDSELVVPLAASAARARDASDPIWIL